MLGWRAELRNGVGAEDECGPERDRGDALTLRLQNESGLHQPEALSTDCLREAEGEETCVSECCPQLTVDSVVSHLNCGHAIRVNEAGENSRCGLAHCILSFREGEVHYASLVSWWKTGSASSSSKRTISATTRSPMVQSPGSPARLATMRVPSSSAIRPIGSG